MKATINYQVIIFQRPFRYGLFQLCPRKFSFSSTLEVSFDQAGSNYKL